MFVNVDDMLRSLQRELNTQRNKAAQHSVVTVHGFDAACAVFKLAVNSGSKQVSLQKGQVSGQYYVSWGM